MCGIAGAFAAPGDRRAIDQMVEYMNHRGPDDRGVQLVDQDAGLWLGSTRLAIIDTSAAGRMPMEDAETGNWIVYNGEIYNFPEIREDLENRGVRFSSMTDTEVVLKAYRVWGADLLQRVRGMFAFAVWDSKRRRVLLARDRLGLKPLYFWSGPQGQFLWASEVRALLASGCVPRVVDANGLDCLLANGFLVSPLTIVAGVRSLFPGHYIEIDADAVPDRAQKYWDLSSADIGPGDPPLTEVRHRLAEAVTMRMISDVPLGAFLSGGLDSTSVVALMSSAEADVRTFSITFDEAEYDESMFSRRAAARFATRHTEQRLTRATFLDWLPAATAALDQPSFDGVNTYCVSRAARESGLTVALSGLGADELFGGYSFFGSIPRLGAALRMPRRLQRSAYEVAHRPFRRRQRGVAGPAKLLDLFQPGGREGRPLSPELRLYQTVNGIFPSWVRERLMAPVAGAHQSELEFGLPSDFVSLLWDDGVRQNRIDSSAGLDRVTRLALRIFLGERTLRDTDTMSMAVSLEVRAPFTDHLLVEHLLKVPGSIRCAGAPNKSFEWEIVEPIVGRELGRDTKQGFTLPFQKWLSSDEFQPHLRDTFADRVLQQRLGLAPDSVTAVLDTHLGAPSAMPWSRVWTLFVLLRYCDQHDLSLA